MSTRVGAVSPLAPKARQRGTPHLGLRELIEELTNLATWPDKETAHRQAELLLLARIRNDDVTIAFNNLRMDE